MAKNMYKSLFKEVKKIVIESDIVGLIKQGAPEDEYDDEISRIISAMQKCEDAKSLQNLIYAIFKDSFGSSSAGDLKDFSDLATKLWIVKKKDV